MKLSGRHGLGPYYGTHHEFNQVRQVYQYRGATVYVDRISQYETISPWVEVFAFLPEDSCLWFVTEFGRRSWAHSEQRARQAIDEWLGDVTEKEGSPSG